MFEDEHNRKKKVHKPTKSSQIDTKERTKTTHNPTREDQRSEERQRVNIREDNEEEEDKTRTAPKGTYYNDNYVERMNLKKIT